MTITKAEIKLIKSLEKRKHRAEHSLFVVEGEKLLKEAISSGADIVKVFYKDIIGEESMSRITHLSSPSPVLALVRTPKAEEIELPKRGGLYLALDSIKDPGNLGTIVRLSEWFGVDAIYCSEGCTDIYSSKVVQATMGSLFRQKIYTCSLPQLIDKISDYTDIYGTFLSGNSIYSSKFRSTTMFVMGNESEGISANVASKIAHRITIPSFSTTPEGGESLNVAIAAGVVCSQFRGSSLQISGELSQT